MKERTFETIVIRPSWKYYALNMGWLALLSMVLLFIGGMDGVIFHLPLYVASGVIGAFALYQFLYLKKIFFFVTNEQLIVQRGVFLRTWDYIELYRIIDFIEHQDLLQQLIGLKVVTIHSTDRTNPRLQLIGIPIERNIVQNIRERVIYNRSIRNIHEFSNLI